MIKQRFITLFFGLLCSCLGFCSAKKVAVDYVNMYVGTTGKHSTEYGGTTPAVSTPFGMTQWCAATRINKISSTMYHYKDDNLIGFMATHQSAIWMGDYGFFTLMPQSGTLRIKPDQRAVALDRSSEIATPYYYSITHTEKDNSSIKTEFTATSRCSFFRINYSNSQKPILFIEAGRMREGGYIEIVPEKQEIRLYNRERFDAHLGPQLHQFKGCYVMKFSQPFAVYGTWKDGEIAEGNKMALASNVGGYIEFAPTTQTVEVRTGSSFIDFEQAEANLKREIGDNLSFEKTKEWVKESWQKELRKVSIKGASDDERSVFYTAFFRTLQFPREFSEYGRYYSPFDEKIHEGVSYNAYSLWDTFRALHPWLLLMQAERVNPMITALIQMYKEGGWLPKWPNPTYTNIMIGTHADAVIADAYVNGYRDYDVETAYKAIHKNAFTPPRRDEHFKWQDRDFWNGGPQARAGLTHYIKKGYVASDKTNESVSSTLEYALDDYCIAQMAKKMGKMEDYEVLMKRATNYKNLYNKETGFFQARKSDGSWDHPNTGFTEGSKWTYRFCVVQDVPGFIETIGGADKFLQALDENFEKGYYRHDNEPGHHYAYLYNHCNRLDKTQALIPTILAANYQNKPDGLSGNDDLGQMSAWYLFSSLGFYPLTPASGEYALGIPQFEEVTLTLPNGKTLIVIAKNRKKHSLLPVVRLNGKLLDTPFVKIADIMQGGRLEFSSK